MIAHAGWHLAAATLALFVLLAAIPSRPAHAQTHSVQTRYHNLVLRLDVSGSGSTVSVRTALTNRAARAWSYNAGCAPPILQVQAQNAAGKHVYGWVAPRVQCFALAVRALSPHGTIHKHVTFRAHGTIYVRAVVPVNIASGKRFQTREIKIVLPS